MAELPQFETIAPPGPLDWLEAFELTDEEAEQISDPDWIEPGLIPEGHIVAIVAKPNAGKTTILFDLACVLAERGLAVIYVHADTGPADAKKMRETAVNSGVRYLTPDLKVGLSMREVVGQLVTLANSDADLTGQVWLFDTLKKMGDVINKGQLKGLLQLMRKMSARGATLVLLGHTNKYKNADGEYQYEGTADLESDCDELIYFEPKENPDGSLTVSTRCEKRRAEIQPITWDVLSDRTVLRRSEYVDVQAISAKEAQLEIDQPCVEAITEILRDRGSAKQTEVVAYCRDLKLSEKRIRAVLKRYSGELWSAEKQFEKNAWRYELKAKTAPPAKLPNCQTESSFEGF